MRAEFRAHPCLEFAGDKHTRIDTSCVSRTTTMHEAVPGDNGSNPMIHLVRTSLKVNRQDIVLFSLPYGKCSSRLRMPFVNRLPCLHHLQLTLG